MDKLEKLQPKKCKTEEIKTSDIKGCGDLLHPAQDLVVSLQPMKVKEAEI